MFELATLLISVFVSIIFVLIVYNRKSDNLAKEHAFNATFRIFFVVLVVTILTGSFFLTKIHFQAKKEPQRGGVYFNANYENANWAGKDLTSCIFYGANLAGAHLDNANLTHTDFSKANLVNAHLIGSKLVACNLRGTDLSGALLNKADLTDADLKGAILNGTDLTCANLFSVKGLSTGQLKYAKYSTSTRLPPEVAPTIEMQLSSLALENLEMYYSDLNNSAFDARKYFSDPIEKYITMENTKCISINAYINGYYRRQYKQATFTMDSCSFQLEDIRQRQFTFIENSKAYIVASGQWGFSRYYVRLRVDEKGKIRYFRQYKSAAEESSQE